MSLAARIESKACNQPIVVDGTCVLEGPARGHGSHGVEVGYRAITITIEEGVLGAAACVGVPHHLPAGIYVVCPTKKAT